MDKPDVPAALELAAAHDLAFDPFATSYFLSRETVIPAPQRAMMRWRQNLFETISRNAGRAVEFFGIPHNAVIELGTRVQLEQAICERIRHRATKTTRRGRARGL